MNHKYIYNLFKNNKKKEKIYYKRIKKLLML